MGPNPASRLKWNGSFVLGNEVLVNNPEMGSIVASVISGWSNTEAELGRVFGTLVGTKLPVTISMYSTLRNFDSQKEVLRVCAKESLPLRYALLFNAALNVLSQAAQDRHKFAHWIWGASEDADLQALLLIEPKHIWKLHVSQLRSWNTNRGKNTINKIGPVDFMLRQPRLSPEHIFVYRPKDLQEVKARVERAYRIAVELRNLVVSNASRRRVIYRWLCAESDILSALEKEKKQHSRKLLVPRK